MPSTRDRGRRSRSRSRSRSPYRRRSPDRGRGYDDAYRRRSPDRGRDKDTYRHRSPDRDRDRNYGTRDRDRDDRNRDRDNFKEMAREYSNRGSRRDNRPSWMTGKEGDRSNSRQGGKGGKGGKGKGKGNSNANLPDTAWKNAEIRSASSLGSTNKADSEQKLGKEEEMQRQLLLQQQREQQQQEDEVLNEKDADALLLAMTTDGDAEEEKRIAERKRRRAAIMAKHHQEPPAPTQPVIAPLPPTSVMAPAEGATQGFQPSALGMSSENGTNLKPSSRPSLPDTAAGAVGTKPGSAVLQSMEVAKIEEEKGAKEEPMVEVVESKKDEEIFDMFGDVGVPPKQQQQQRGDTQATGALPAGLDGAAMAGAVGHEDDHDDGEGYYKTRPGEMLLDRFLVRGALGKGVFSTVLSCIDLTKQREVFDAAAKAAASAIDEAGNASGSTSAGPTEAHQEQAMVAIKLIRNNDVMRKAALKEMNILTEIARTDPDNRRHCVRLLGNFEHRNHTAMVFERYAMNLRETLKKFGKNVGINIGAVQKYSRQLLVALKHLWGLRVVHADIKPDNILVSGDFRTLKICDFGSAFRETDSDVLPTPYLVSRFYRAPEITLGLEYDHQVDLWSVGVCLFELFTGRVMFPGRDNNHMVALFMDMKGRFNNKQIKRHILSYGQMEKIPHFSDDLRFRQLGIDKVTGKAVVRFIDVNPHPIVSIRRALMDSKAGGDEQRVVVQLSELLEKALQLDPERRIQIKAALEHPFVKTKN